MILKSNWLLNNNNPFLRLVLLNFFLILGCQKSNQEFSETKLPNVILILTDDQGYGDLGFTGNKHIETPHLDALKAQSVFMENFYVSPVCSPTRASIMTGKFALRTGVYDTFNGGALMNTEETTIAELLQTQNYKTAIFGKWHLGSSYPFRPSDQGFQTSLIHHAGGIGQPGDPENYSNWNNCYFNPNLYLNNKLIATKGYCSDVFTNATLDFIDQNDKQPFFTYLSFNAPHDPLQVPNEWYEKYKTLNFDEGISNHALQKVNLTEIEKEEARKVYGMVSNLDYNIGRLIDKLKEKNIYDNTLIIFLSDNGPKSKRFNCNLRGKKGSVYDGGVKSPCLIKLSGKPLKHKSILTPVAHIDLLPTITAHCNVDPRLIKGIDGLNLLPLIHSKKDSNFLKRNIYEQWGRMFPERYHNISVRKGPYKLIGQTDINNIESFELYNTMEDPGEIKNLYHDENEIAITLKKELDDWFDKQTFIEGHPKKLFIELNPDKENELVLTRNEMRGSPEIWNKDFVYGYWDVDVKKEGYYDVLFNFESNAKKQGKLYVKQHPLQYSIANIDTTKTQIRLNQIKLRKGKEKLEVFYKTGWNETMIPFTVKITKTPNLDN